MSQCLVLWLILILQLVGGMASSAGSDSSTIGTEDPTTASTEQPGKSAWWCNELFGIISLAAVGTSLFFTIILCIVSCCLWKKINCSKKESLTSNNTDMKDRELDMMGPQAPLDRTVFPIPDVGPSDVENCTVNSELSKKETPQETEDQPTDEGPMLYPPPEDIP